MTSVLIVCQFHKTVIVHCNFTAWSVSLIIQINVTDFLLTRVKFFQQRKDSELLYCNLSRQLLHLSSFFSLFTIIKTSVLILTILSSYHMRFLWLMSNKTQVSFSEVKGFYSRKKGLISKNNLPKKAVTLNSLSLVAPIVVPTLLIYLQYIFTHIFTRAISYFRNVFFLVLLSQTDVFTSC